MQKAPAAKLEVLANALCELLGRDGHPIDVIGTRHGEKQHETLLSREERSRFTSNTSMPRSVDFQR